MASFRTLGAMTAAALCMSLATAHASPADTVAPVPPPPTPSSAKSATPPRDTFPDTWVATDGLGRVVATGAQTGPPRTGKTVGIFYFLSNHVPNGHIYDITQMLA